MVKAGEALRPDALTVNERVLLHLRECGTPRESWDAHPLTQPGIAETLGIRVNHVSRAVKQLIRQRLIAEGTARVRGEVRKRKVYAVTPEGHALAGKLATEVAQRKVVAVEASGERTLDAGDAKRLVTPSTLSRLLAAVDADGRLDLRTPSRAPARGHAIFEEGRPAPHPLIGRASEEGAFRKWLQDGPPILAVIGPRGIGKTALVTSCIDDRARFWWSFRERDTPAAFLEGLAAWLARLGKGDLRTHLSGAPPGWREFEKLLVRDLRGSDAVLVLDDFHAAGSDLAPYLDATVASAAEADCRVVVTTEAPLAHRAELRADRRLREVALRGLDRAASRALVPDVGDAEFDAMYRLTHGNPLSLKLLAAEEAPGEFTPEERALMKVLKMRQDEG